MRPTKITNIMQDAKTLFQRLFIIFIFIIIFLSFVFSLFFIQLSLVDLSMDAVGRRCCRRTA